MQGVSVGVAGLWVWLWGNGPLMCVIMCMVSKWVWLYCVSTSGHAVVVSEEEFGNATTGTISTNITVSPGETNPSSHDSSH